MDLSLKGLLFSLLYFNLPVLSFGDKISDLKKAILDPRNVQIRPVIKDTNRTVINVMIYPLYVVDLNEQSQVFILDARIAVEWTDERLKWNENDYGGFTEVDVEEHEVWIPDFKVLTSSPTSSIDPYSKTLVNIQKSGIVRWSPTATFRSRCALDYTDYPYDKQRCLVNITSWTDVGEDIDAYMMTNEADLTYFANDNPKWDFTDSKCERTLLNFVGIYIISCTYVLSRRMPHGRDVEWVSALVVILLTLIMFWMPPEKGKKLMLGCTSLLVLFAELLFFTLTSPSLGIAMFSAHLLQQSIFVVLSAILLEILIINLTRISGFPPPALLVDLLSGPLNRIFCLCSQDDNKTELQRDWYNVALSLNRILFILYAIIFLALKKWV